MIFQYSYLSCWTILRSRLCTRLASYLGWQLLILLVLCQIFGEHLFNLQWCGKSLSSVIDGASLHSSKPGTCWLLHCALTPTICFLRPTSTLMLSYTFKPPKIAQNCDVDVALNVLKCPWMQWISLHVLHTKPSWSIIGKGLKARKITLFLALTFVDVLQALQMNMLTNSIIHSKLKTRRCSPYHQHTRFVTTLWLIRTEGKVARPYVKNGCTFLWRSFLVCPITWPNILWSPTGLVGYTWIYTIQYFKNTF